MNVSNNCSFIPTAMRAKRKSFVQHDYHHFGSSRFVTTSLMIWSCKTETQTATSQKTTLSFSQVECNTKTVELNHERVRKGSDLE